MTVNFFSEPYVLYIGDIPFTGKPLHIHVIQHGREAVAVLGWGINESKIHL